MAPAATIGPVTDAATLSVLGIASLPDRNGNTLANRNDMWLGATQPIGSVGRVRLAALGSGNLRFREGIAGETQAQGLLTVRARARFGDHRVWSAVSYGRSSVNGNVSDGTFENTMLSSLRVNTGTVRAATLGDTTITRRLDVGQIGRAEAGMVTTYAGLEFAVGLSLERTSRVTTQTITTDGPAPAITFGANRSDRSTSELRTVQQRDLATAIASLGFNTGSTQWLMSVTAPFASWLTADALAPRPQPVPAVATLAVVQPISGWLSLFGAAATNAATVGGPMLRDELRDRSRSQFSPVVALGVRISRLPWRNHDGTPQGILSFETRTLGTVDSASIDQGLVTRDGTNGDTLRVVLMIDAPRAESVELMGDATQWSITALRRLQNGRWRTELKLPPGMHRLAVRADGGQWIAPPGLPIGNDEFGSPVGVIIVKGRHPR